MRTKKAKEPSAPPKAEFPVVLETYRKPDRWDLDRFSIQPSAFNGMVNFRKYRVTIEAVEEPKEVLAERLLKLWRESDNHHEWEPIKSAAASIGVELPYDQYGKDRKPRQ